MKRLEELLMKRQTYLRLLKTQEAAYYNGSKHRKRIKALKSEITIIDQEIIRNLDESD